jgi:hypothetical protein
MSESQDLRGLVGKLLDGLAASTKLAPILEHSIRVAELRGDYFNLWWLRKESLDLDDKRANRELRGLMSTHIPAEYWWRPETAVKVKTA